MQETSVKAACVLPPLLHIHGWFSVAWKRGPGATESLVDILPEQLFDGETLARLGQIGFPLRGCHLVEQHIRALELNAFEMVQRPHVLVIEDNMRLRNERLAIGTDIALILYDVGQLPAMVAGFPLTLADQSAHRRCLAALVFATERMLIGPLTCLGTVCPYLAIYGIHNSIFPDHAGDHTCPAAVWIDIPSVFEGDGLVSIGLGQACIMFPPLAIPVVPARILKLKPLEVFLGQGVDTPKVDWPAGGEELCHLMHVALIGDTVPGLLNVIVMNLQAILLQRHQVTTIIVVVDPAPPHLRIALAILATVLRSVLNEGTNCRVDDTVVIPESVLEVAFQQQVVFGIGQGHQESGIAIADVS